MRNFFKRDNIWLGIGMAIAITGLSYLLLILINSLISSTDILQNSTMKLLAIFVNLIPFRYYLVKLKADKTGRGILLVTFILSMLYFYFNITL